MRKNLVGFVDSCQQDNLIARLSPPAETTGIILKKLGTAGVVKRGTLLAADAEGKYSVYGGPGNSKTQTFSGDNATTTFTVTDKPAAIDSVKVGGVDATVSSYNAYTGELELSEAPTEGSDNVVVSYSLGGGSIPSMILADDVEVGDGADETGVAYRSGNFNRNAIITADEYVLTAADEDTLRKYDIIFTQTV